MNTSLRKKGVEMKKIAILFLLLVSIISYSKTFKIDPVHSHVGFKVKYLTLTSVQGRFDAFTGRVSMKNGEISEINGEINVSSINTNNSKRDAHLKSSDFFNLELYPKILFQSSQVVKDGDQYVVLGDLEIHGIRRKVSIPFNATPTIKGTKGNERMGLVGHLKINRKNFGLSYSKKLDNGGLVVDDYVDIELNVQAVEEKTLNEQTNQVI